MKRYKTVDEYILNAQNGKEILIVLRVLRQKKLKHGKAE